MTTVESSITRDIEDLRVLRHHLWPSAQPFISSILDFHARKGYVTEKQAPYVKKYAEECRLAEGNKLVENRNETEEIFDGQRILRLFTTAARTLKFPKIQLQNSAFPGGTLQLHRAGERSKSPGWIMFSNGKRPPEYFVYASIDLTGTGILNRRIPVELKKAIRDFAKEPEELAARNGRKTGVCCFCARSLTHPASLHHGYGPICAEKFGLPWEGEQKAAVAAEVELYPVEGLDKLTLEDL